MFTHDSPPPVVKKRLSFLSVLVMCITTIIVTAIVSGSGVLVYGVRMIDRKADTLPKLVAQVAESLPALYDALPPAIVDAVDDERAPEYLANLKIKVQLRGDADRWGRRRAVVEVENTGDETVSLLTMRIVALDGDGEPLGEERTWAASPIQMDNSWRGPILPHTTRRFVVRCREDEEVSSVSHEVTDIRVWRGYEDEAGKDDDGNVAKVRA